MVAALAEAGGEQNDVEVNVPKDANLAQHRLQAAISIQQARSLGRAHNRRVGRGRELGNRPELVKFKPKPRIPRPFELGGHLVLEQLLELGLLLGN